MSRWTAVEDDARLLDDGNVCGQALLQLTARGAAVIAELLRLSARVPDVFRRPGPVIFDFAYLKMPDKFEGSLNADPEMVELDLETQAQHRALVERFFLLFESIVRYARDYNKVVRDLRRGFYIHHSVEGLLQDRDGKQLLAESLYLLGTMLLLLERQLPGLVRERLVVSHLRAKGAAALISAEDVILLCKDTGSVFEAPPGPPSLAEVARAAGVPPPPPAPSVQQRLLQRAMGGAQGEAESGAEPGARRREAVRRLRAMQLEQQAQKREKFATRQGARRGAGQPEGLFARFPVDKHVARMIVGTLQSDDIYGLTRAFPAPEHRSVALAAQASLLVVVLYFVPEVLREKRAAMREIVDKFFHDNWIVPVHLGSCVDLQLEWAPYPAARAALADVLRTETVQELQASNVRSFRGAQQAAAQYLTRGLLTDSFVLENTAELLHTLREANAALRWVVLHRTSSDGRLFRLVACGSADGSIQEEDIADLLLRTAQLESRVKEAVKRLLEGRLESWEACKRKAAARMGELSAYFTGTVALTRVERDETLVQWFARIQSEIESLEHTKPTLAGRRILKLIDALAELEQYEEIETSLQIKQFLADSRALLERMVRAVGLREQVLTSLDIISDMSYAWELMRDYRPQFHARLREDPGAVALLRAAFVKMASILDAPLTRIAQAGSPDAASVAAYYSRELVQFVREVLQVIPTTVFDLLLGIVALQAGKLRPVPPRLDTAALAEVEQSALRYALSQMTHAVSTFTEGVLAMRTTLLGVVEVDPRRILEDGIRKELVKRICAALDEHTRALEPTGASAGALGSAPRLDEKALAALATALDGFRRSFEYVQDYIGLNGLKVWQHEYARVMQSYLEHECSAYRSKASRAKRKVPAPPPHSVPVPIPLPRPGDRSFLARLEAALLRATAPGPTAYAPEWATWLDTRTGDEAAGARLVAELGRAVGVPGLSALDRLLCYRTVHACKEVIGVYDRVATSQGPSGLPLLQQIAGELSGAALPASATFAAAVRQLAKDQQRSGLAIFLPSLVTIGQLQLLREKLRHELAFASQVHASLLHSALANRGRTAQLRARQTGALPANAAELAAALECSGLDDPRDKVYIRAAPCPRLPELLLLAVSMALPRLELDAVLGTLVYSRRDDRAVLDGAPLAAGLAALLRQFSPDYLQRFLALGGRLARALLVEKAPQLAAPHAKEAAKLIHLLRHVCQFARRPQRDLDVHIATFVVSCLARQP